MLMNFTIEAELISIDMENCSNYDTQRTLVLPISWFIEWKSFWSRNVKSYCTLQLSPSGLRNWMEQCATLFSVLCMGHNFVCFSAIVIKAQCTIEHTQTFAAATFKLFSKKGKNDERPPRTVYLR